MASEDLIRMGSYLSVLGVMATWELLAPRRMLTASKLCRWGGNLTIVILNTVIARLFFMGGVVAVATMAQDRGWGLLNWFDGPVWLELGLAVVALDFIIYWQHQMFHFIPILWRFHMMHHSDLDLDVSSGVRFHPVEIVASMGVKIGLVYLLGPQAVAVVLFEVLLNATALFNHANLRLPLWLDRVLRLVLVTPDMHRVHHSVIRAEHDSNFGFALSVWDRIFGTYRAQPEAGHDGMVVGLEWQDDKPAKLGWSLWLPFR